MCIRDRNYSAAASKTLAELTDMCYGNLPVCIAKTQYKMCIRDRYSCGFVYGTTNRLELPV